MERRVTSPAGGFTAPPSLQEAHNSSAFRAGRHFGKNMSTTEKHLRKEVSTYRHVGT
jgi:hypothetical protein